MLVDNIPFSSAKTGLLGDS